MTAEEFLVECYKQLKEDFDEANKTIEELREDIDGKNDKISNYENLIYVLQKHISVDKYGISIEFRNYKAEDKDDIEYLKDYFDVDFSENDECSK
jgi:predicted  nucleic acid-binding Zn-ribbon protein